MKSETRWQSAKRPKFGKLKKSSEFDVAVIGGGITGMTAAYLLTKAGKRVCVLERHTIGFVDTGLTTAHLTYVTDLRPTELIKFFGIDAAPLVWEAGSAAIDAIEAVARDEKIECEFRRVPGFLHASLKNERDETSDLADDAEAALKLGFPAAFVASVPFFKKPGVRFPDQAKFHPLKYLYGLAQAVVANGGAIFEEADVSEVRDDPQRVIVGEYEIGAEYIVIATHVPLMGKTGVVNATLFQSKLFPYSSYVIGAKTPKGLLPEACFWDTSDPYYYLRVERGGTHDYVIFGGEDHKTGQASDTNACFARLRETLLQIIPQAKPDRQWSGQVIETNDGLPYIGETAEKQFVATGFSGNGMTFGTIGGVMACDAALGRSNLWQKLFSVNRKKLRGGTWDYVTENMDYPYYLVKDRFSRSEGNSTRDVKRGEGKIIEMNGERVACSRDEKGKVTTVSAVCTHMGCFVRWNQAEKTWDCPCHGSRFLPNGEVLGGPAESPLESVKGTPGQPASKKKDTK